MAKSVHCTPVATSTTINKVTGKKVYLKMENQQKTGSFKVRGSSYKISRLSDQQAQNGVIAASAGNHAQGVALAAAKRGVKATIYMPEKTPEAKVLATRTYGAQTVLTGASFQDALLAAQDEQKRTNSTFIHPFDDPDIMAGQGTIAVEMLQQIPVLDSMIVPVGGGGLISGIAVAAKSIKPSIRIIGVQTKSADAMYHKFHRLGGIKKLDLPTLAEGIAVKTPGALTSDIICQYVDDMVTVSDHDIAAAILFMLERQKTLLEGAGAAALAALLVHGHRIKSRQCGVIASGGNIDLAKLPIIQALSKENHLSCLA
nr:threonine ammonia-lyase [Falsibacillus albus]